MLASGEDWLLRPVLAGRCAYESLKNGALDLADIDRLNEALDIEAANRQRFADHVKAHNANVRRR